MLRRVVIGGRENHREIWRKQPESPFSSCTCVFSGLCSPLFLYEGVSYKESKKKADQNTLLTAEHVLSTHGTYIYTRVREVRL